MHENDNERASGEEPTPLKSGENEKGKRWAPKNNFAIAGVARRHVRNMIDVLKEIAMDKEHPPSPRVSAAKAVIDFARMKPEDVREMTNEEIRTLAKKIVENAAETVEDAKYLKRKTKIH